MTIASVILAAGLSRRMGPQNKLLQSFDGRPLAWWAAQAAQQAGLGPVIIVTGHQRESVIAVLPSGPLTLAHNADFQQGMASSLACGIAAVPEEAAGAFILLADMPLIRSDHLRRMADAFRQAEGTSVIVPIHDGKRGNPVLFPKMLFPDLRGLTGDRGGKSVIAAHGDMIQEIDLADNAIWRDVDTPADFEN